MPFELRPRMPEEGLSVTADGLGHSQRVEEYLKRISAQEGEPMVLPDLVPKTHRAIVLGEVARDAGPDVHRAAHAAVFRAHFRDGADIGSAEVLLGVAETVEGLDPAAVQAAWDSGSMETRIEGFRHLAGHLGIDRTPAALICNELLIGSRPYDMLAEAVARCLEAPADEEGGETGPDAPEAPKR